MVEVCDGTAQRVQRNVKNVGWNSEGLYRVKYPIVLAVGTGESLT